MRDIMIYGALGLLYGLVLQKCGFTRRSHVRRTVLLREFTQARTWLYTLGLGMIGTAFLCWLAVIDVDKVRVLPLHSGVLIGGVLMGVGLGLGVTPGTLLCGTGGGKLPQSLCGLAGCALGWILARALPQDALRTLLPVQEGTLFQLTLTDPWLLGGRFAGLACLGLLICVLTLLIRPKKNHADAIELIKDAVEAAADPEQAEPDHDDVTAILQDAPDSTEQATAADELLLLDELEEPVEDLDADSPASLHAALAQAAATSAEPAPVDDMLPECSADTDDAEAWLHRQAADLPSPMQDEALQDIGAMDEDAHDQ